MNRLLTDADYACRVIDEEIARRNPFETQWREAALHVLPSNYQSMQSSGGVASAYAKAGYGQQSTRKLSYDGTGRRALPRFIAVLDRLLTPRGQRWHYLKTEHRELKKSRRVKLFFEELNSVLFAQRYQARARFVSAATEGYASIGGFGNMIVSIMYRKPQAGRSRGLVYRARPLANFFWTLDDDGNVDATFMRDSLNARQAERRYGRNNLPGEVLRELTAQGGPSETRLFEFFEIVAPDHDGRDPEALDNRRFPIQRRVLFKQTKEFLGVAEGFVSNPNIVSRYFTEPGDSYGTSPAIAALSDMGTASSMSRHHLKLSERLADPPILSHRTGMVVDMRSNAVTGGALGPRGEELVKPMSFAGRNDTRLAEVLYGARVRNIEDHFLGRLFDLLDESRELTAREVSERLGKEFALVAPTMGRLYEEWIDPCVSREVDIIMENDKLRERVGEIPPELVEAEGEYDIVLDSPMARAERMEDIQGFMQAMEMALGIAERTQNPGLVEKYDFDAAFDNINQILNVPVSWTRDPEQLAAVREQQAQQQALQTAVEAAPAAAGLAQALGPNGR